MNIETTGIQQGAIPTQAQNPKDAAADPLAALFAGLLGLFDPMAPAGDSPKADGEGTTDVSKARSLTMPGAPLLPLPFAPGAGGGDTASPVRDVATAEATGTGIRPLKIDRAAMIAVSAGVAADPETKQPSVQPETETNAGAATPANRVPAAGEPITGMNAAPAGSTKSADAAVPPFALKISPEVTLSAPKTTGPAGGEKARPAASAKAEKSATPVSVAFERTQSRTKATTETDAVAPAAEPDDVHTSASAEPEPRALSPHGLAAHRTEPLGPERPAQPAAAGAPLHTATQQVMHRLEKAIEHREDRIRIELEPASLGGVEVQLRIGDDGRVSAIVRADRSDTLALLQNDARGLEQALRDAGLRPEAGSLSFNLRQGEGQAGNQPDPRGQRRRGGAERAVFAIEAVGSGAPARHHLLGGLDIRI